MVDIVPEHSQTRYSKSVHRQKAKSVHRQKDKQAGFLIEKVCVGVVLNIL